MRYLVRIDLETLRENPNYGKRLLHHVGAQVTLKGVGKAPKEDQLAFMEGRITSYRTGVGPEGDLSEWTAAGVVPERPETLEEDIKALGRPVTYEVHNLYRSAESIIDPKYLYQLENPMITCSECHTEMRFSDLTEEEGQHSGDAWNDKVCPICRKWDCCELEFETVEQALRRKEQHEVA